MSTPVQGGSTQDIYVRDMTTSSPKLVSIDTAGTAGGDSSSFQPEISANGADVAFFSLANNLTTNDTGNESIASEEVFERNLQTNTTILVSTNAAGTASPTTRRSWATSIRPTRTPRSRPPGRLAAMGSTCSSKAWRQTLCRTKSNRTRGAFTGPIFTSATH